MSKIFNIALGEQVSKQAVVLLDTMNTRQSCYCSWCDILVLGLAPGSPDCTKALLFC